MKNRALTGGGLSLYSNLGEERLRNRTTVTVSNTTFLGNRAVISAAVDIAPIREEFGLGFLPISHFSDCSFLENTVIDTGKSNRSFHHQLWCVFCQTFQGNLWRKYDLHAQ